MKYGRAALVVLALCAPALGTLFAAQMHFGEIAGFWRGLIIQGMLLFAPLEAIVSRRSLKEIGLPMHGNRRSLSLGAVLSALYLVALGAATLAGIPSSHFDQARRVLGTPAVLLLYVPFWGVLEGVWIVYLLATVSRLLGKNSVGWVSILIAALWFGILHTFIQLLLNHASLSYALSYSAVGLLVVLAGAILKYTGSGWGFVLFWLISNF